MKVKRSDEMQLVAYALARCGEPSTRREATLPPSWLGTTSWKRAYEMFFDALGDGRTPLTFERSLKNARDAFDAHVPSGRTGWVDHKAGGVAYRQDVMVGRVLAEWEKKSDDELRDAVLDILWGTAPQVPEESNARTEGGTKLYLAKRYERDPRLRADAIKVHGTRCMACKLDFGERYGTHGQGFIEVHHAVPLAEAGVRETDPATDLLVLCANCHRMVHRKRGVCLSLSELKSKLQIEGTHDVASL